MPHPLLVQYRKDSPGVYLAPAELQRLVDEDPSIAPRVQAAIAAQAQEKVVLDRVIPAVLKKYDFRKAFEYGESKCYRDVGAVYRWCVFAMLCDDQEMLENKLLIWMGVIVRSLNFPSGRESIRYCYKLLRKEAMAALDPAKGALLDPYFAAAELILPGDEVNANG